MARQHPKQQSEPDSVFVMKVILFFLLGSLWVRFEASIFGADSIALPVGLLIGLYFAHHDHFQIDKKIEYVVLLIATLLSFVAPIGFVLTI